jgi:ATP-dependent 26S proteasome regulatory subunit
MEEHNGIIFLSTNKRDNMDKAFMRRFHSHLEFPIPDEESRMQLLLNAFGEHTPFLLDKKISLLKVAREQKSLTGATIKRFQQYIAMIVTQKGSNLVNEREFIESLRTCMRMEGKDLGYFAF